MCLIPKGNQGKMRLNKLPRRGSLVLLGLIAGAFLISPHCELHRTFSPINAQQPLESEGQPYGQKKICPYGDKKNCPHGHTRNCPLSSLNSPTTKLTEQLSLASMPSVKWSSSLSEPTAARMSVWTEDGAPEGHPQALPPERPLYKVNSSFLI